MTSRLHGSINKSCLCSTRHPSGDHTSYSGTSSPIPTQARTHGHLQVLDTHRGRCRLWTLPTIPQGLISSTPLSPFLRGSQPRAYFRLESSTTRPCTVSVASSNLAASQALIPTRVLAGKGGKTGGLPSLDSSAKLCSGGFCWAWSCLLQIVIPFPDRKPPEAEP